MNVKLFLSQLLEVRTMLAFHEPLADRQEKVVQTVSMDDAPPEGPVYLPEAAFLNSVKSREIRSLRRAALVSN